MIKVSVIMPSKNVRAYIKECLLSVQNQTLDEIEILCIDAFSTDGTREIITKCAAQDARIKLIDDEKGSTGYSFQKALKLAKGEYISIVETDDYIRKDMLEILYEKAVFYNLDFIKADFKAILDIDSNRFFVEIPTFYNEDKKYYNRIINKDICHNLRIFDGYVWKGIYKRKFLLDNNIFMHETKGAAFQDQGFLYQTIQKADKVMYLDEELYYYRRDNENSSVYSSNMIDNMMKEYQLIEQDIVNKKFSIAGWEDVFYYEKFARYKNVLKQTAKRLWKEKLNTIREQFQDPLINGFISEKSGYVYQDLMKLYLSVDYYIDALIKELDFCKNRIRNVVCITNKKNVVIFGEGLIGKDVLCAIKRFGTGTVKCFMDNDERKWGKQVNKILVESPAEMEQYKDCFFVIANEKHVIDIWKQLIKNGISAQNISICNYVLDSYEVTSMKMKID